MASTNIYKDIAQRTGGDIYIGVVGPVRTGKSTFIKKFCELMVIPNVIALFALGGLVVSMTKFKKSNELPEIKEESTEK